MRRCTDYFAGDFAAISALRAALRAVALRNAPAGAVRAASFFLDAQKETKEAPGRRSGRTLRVHIRGPWTPFLRGRQLGKLSGHRQGAGGQKIGFRSITAAAEGLVTFGWCSSWLEARLLGWWGSSAAQGIGVS